MRHERRAIVFDLDDTLYPYSDFVISGFGAVAVHLERTLRIGRARALESLHRATDGPARGRELQRLVAELGLPASLVDPLRLVMRSHTPSLRLPRTSRLTLATLRRRGWRIGVLTNGRPEIQCRKAQALGLFTTVDAVVYAANHGTRSGKPDPAAFAAMTRRLDTPASRTIVVGDDEQCDVEGALASGMVAIRTTQWTSDVEPISSAHAVVDRLTRVPRLADALLDGAQVRHVA